MIRPGAVLLALAGLSAAFAAAARDPAGVPNPRMAGTLPATVGACAQTVIAKISDRFGGDINAPDGSAGSAVSYANGGYQVSYETVGALARSRIGDPVMMCLVSLPRNCPKGDERGRIYTTTNKRTGEAWSLPDSQHLCGGA